jgi:hypothetical protein
MNNFFEDLIFYKTFVIKDLSKNICYKKLDIKYLYYNTYSVCVWHSIGSAPGRDTNLRPVSLEPSGSEPAIFQKNFPEK